MLHRHRLRMREVPGEDVRPGRRPVLDQQRGSPPTTWSRCCLALLVGLARRRPVSKLAMRLAVDRRTRGLTSADRAFSWCRSSPPWCCSSSVLEMVRRRRLMERYALLWLLSALVLLGLGIWTDLLAKISHAIGVAYPPNARVPRRILSSFCS